MLLWIPSKKLGACELKTSQPVGVLVARAPEACMFSMLHYHASQDFRVGSLPKICGIGSKNLQ